ncbi:MAG: glycoside hydrolase family 3 C-terminal domain-containing protein [Bacteroidetes bacterium]|nr:glycoside hydrolase family 3 C-terminal domain-containing protein [Bacteroidota bacterium]
MRTHNWIRLTAVLLILAAGCTKEDEPNDATKAKTIDEQVEALLGSMTLEEKIGQMTQAERGALTNITDIKTYHLGSLLSGGGSSPSSNTPSAWADMYDGYQAMALSTRLKIPLLYGIDAVHGHNNVKGATIFPHNIGLGATRDADLVKRAAAVVAKEVAGTGIDWTFAPCIAVPRDERWGRTYEGFGETPELQVMMAPAAVQGFQGTLSGKNTEILACAKHFVGDGGTAGGDDQGNTVLTEEQLRAIHMPGYVEAIKQGVGSIMASYNSWNGTKLHGHKYLLTDVLKGELGFQGFVVSDWEAVDQISGDYPTAILYAISAGVDMVMVPIRYQYFIAELKKLVQRGDIPMYRIDDAVRRILKVKFRMGLFEKPFTDRSLTATVGSAAHRAVARECVQKSLVLLKNSNAVLPLKKNAARIHVAGKNADDIGNQCGGWTISWQGMSGNITTGTTILQALRKAVPNASAVTFSVTGSGAAGADVGIVVVGETPYAEGAGDNSQLTLSSEDLSAVANMKAAGIPVVVILISGRPMIINSVVSEADAVVAAWLPGTEGEGVADVLFGDVNFSGVLPHSWPRSVQQLPLNLGDAVYDPLFPYGFGLKYGM